MTNGMRDLLGKTAQQVTEALKEEEAEVIQNSSANLAGLRPKISDKASFDKLVAAVEESTKRNEDVGQLKDRLIALGEGVAKVAKEVTPLLKLL